MLLCVYHFITTAIEKLLRLSGVCAENQIHAFSGEVQLNVFIYQGSGFDSCSSATVSAHKMQCLGAKSRVI